MKLKSVVFYQSVRLWDGTEAKTVNEQAGGVEIDLREGIVTLYKPGEKNLLIIPTANMRMGTFEELGDLIKTHEGLVEVHKAIAKNAGPMPAIANTEAIKEHECKFHKQTGKCKQCGKTKE